MTTRSRRRVPVDWSREPASDDLLSDAVRERLGLPARERRLELERERDELDERDRGRGGGP